MMVSRIRQYRGRLEAELLFPGHDVVDPRRPGVASSYAWNLETELAQTAVHLHHVPLVSVCARTTP